MVSESVGGTDVAPRASSRSSGGRRTDLSRHHRRGNRLNCLSTLGKCADRGLNSLGMHGYRSWHDRRRCRGRLIDWGLSDWSWLQKLGSAETNRVHLDKLNILLVNGFRVAELEAFAMDREEFIIND